MVKLRKLLSESSKIRRHRRILLNIHITFLAWALEVFGFLVGFTFGMIIGHQNNSTRGVQMILSVIYLIIVPGAHIINSIDVKQRIVQSNIYIGFVNKVYGPLTSKVVPINNVNEPNRIVHDGANAQSDADE